MQFSLKKSQHAMRHVYVKITTTFLFFQLYYLRLPKDIKDYKVILMDATVATGAAAMMAIRVLLDHDVPESNILIVSLLMAESGVHSIAYAFPEVQIVTTAIDPEINDKFYVLPGMGNFGDRYFGTEPSDDVLIQ